jgi:hypothetical protein
MPDEQCDHDLGGCVLCEHAADFDTWIIHKPLAPTAEMDPEKFCFTRRPLCGCCVEYMAEHKDDMVPVAKLFAWLAQMN